MPTKTSKKIEFVKDKETKGYIVFKEAENPVTCGVYVRKDVAAELGLTDSATITIEA